MHVFSASRPWIGHRLKHVAGCDLFVHYAVEALGVNPWENLELESLRQFAAVFNGILIVIENWG